MADQAPWMDSCVSRHNGSEVRLNQRALKNAVRQAGYAGSRAAVSQTAVQRRLRSRTDIT